MLSGKNEWDNLKNVAIKKFQEKRQKAKSYLISIWSLCCQETCAFQNSMQNENRHTWEPNCSCAAGRIVCVECAASKACFHHSCTWR